MLVIDFFVKKLSIYNCTFCFNLSIPNDSNWHEITNKIIIINVTIGLYFIPVTPKFVCINVIH